MRDIKQYSVHLQHCPRSVRCLLVLILEPNQSDPLILTCSIFTKCGQRPQQPDHIATPDQASRWSPRLVPRAFLPSITTDHHRGPGRLRQQAARLWPLVRLSQVLVGRSVSFVPSGWILFPCSGQLHQSHRRPLFCLPRTSGRLVYQLL